MWGVALAIALAQLGGEPAASTIAKAGDAATATIAKAGDAATATLAIVGDVNLLGQRDGEHVFDAVRPLLDAADFAFGNLEGLLLDAPAAYGVARLNITMPSRLVAALARSGLDAFGLANNHAWDHGAAGLLEHLAHLEAHGLVTFGAGRDDASARAAHRVQLAVGCVAIVPATFKSNKRPRAGAFAATYTLKDLGSLVARLDVERAANCFVIVSVHAGTEGAAIPPRAVQEAYRALAEHADLVVGHHPHVLEGIERRGDSVIAYSLGNFVFHNGDPDKRRSAILELVLVHGGDRPRLQELALRPITIDAATFAPRPATAREAALTAQALAERSRPFGTSIDTNVFDRLRVERR